MMEKDEIIQLIRSNTPELLDLSDVNTIKILVDLLSHEEPSIRERASQMLYSAPLFPAEEIFKSYLQTPTEFLKKEIQKGLDRFIPILQEYLISEEYFEATFSIISELKAKELFSALKKAYNVTPASAVLCELAIRTCHSSFSNFEQSLISFQIIESNEKKIKDLLKFRLSQGQPFFVELVLRTVLQFPELIKFIVNEIKNIIISSDNENQVSLASYAIMQLQEKKYSDCLISRLEKKEDSDSVKLSIIEALGNIGDEKAAKILLRQFEKAKENEKLGYYTAQSLALLGEKIIPYLIKNLNRDELVPYIIEALKRLGEKSYDYLLRALEKEKKSIKKNAAQCLTLIMSEKYGYEGAIEVLVQKLIGKDSVVINSVTEALLSLGTPAIKVLIGKLNSTDLQLRKNSLKVLEHFGLPNIEIALDDELEVNEKEAVKTAVILFLYYHNKEAENIAREFAIKNDKLRIKDEEIFDVCVNACQDFDSTVREKACIMLQYFGDKAVPYLTKLMSDHNINVRRKAVSSLQKVKSKRALIKLLEAVKDKDTVIAEIATRTLGELGDLGAADAIVNNLKSNNTLLRDAAIYALTQLGPKAISKISPLLSDKGLHEPISTIVIQIGPPALEYLLKDLKKKKSTWFNGVKQIVRKMGSDAKPILEKLYDSASTDEEKAKLLLLMAYTASFSRFEELGRLIFSDYSSYAIESLNFLGRQVSEDLVKFLENLTPQKQKIFLNKAKKLNDEVIMGIIEQLKKKDTTSKMLKQLEKFHQKYER